MQNRLASFSPIVQHVPVMNETTIETKNETGKLPFPSTVTTGCPNPQVRELATEIVDIARDTNNLLASAGNVHNFVRSHYVDVENGVYGIESLINSILKANDSVFPIDSEKTELRAVIVAKSMFAAEIIAAVRVAFGADRYPDHSIKTFLSSHSPQVVAVQLSGKEDSTRTCPKPRAKYYLIQKPA